MNAQEYLPAHIFFPAYAYLPAHAYLLLHVSMSMQNSLYMPAVVLSESFLRVSTWHACSCLHIFVAHE